MSMASLDLESNIVKPQPFDNTTFPDILQSPSLLENDSSHVGAAPHTAATNAKHSVYKSLGWLDRLLALWILLAIIVGILIGNFVDGAEVALQQGRFVNVSAPIGMRSLLPLGCEAEADDV